MLTKVTTEQLKKSVYNKYTARVRGSFLARALSLYCMFAESFKFHYKLFFHFGFFSNVEWCLISTEVHTVL